MDLAIFKIDLRIRVHCTPKRDHWKIAVAELRNVEELKKLLDRVGKGAISEEVADEVVHRGGDVVKDVEVNETIIEEFDFRLVR